MRLKLACLGGLLLIAGLGGCRKPAPTFMATVNGEAITASDYFGTMNAMFGAQTMQVLIERRLILQEGKKQGITADESEIRKLLPDIEKTTTDPEARRALEEELRVRQVTRKLLLKDVSEERKREVYDFFKNELIQYELSIVLTTTRQEATDAVAGLKSGKGFDVVAKGFSQDPSAKFGGRVGFLTVPGISRVFGDQVADTVKKMETNTFKGPLHSTAGPLVVKLGEVRTSYEQLKPSIEDIIANSRQSELIYRIGKDANIVNSPDGSGAKATPVGKGASPGR